MLPENAQYAVVQDPYMSIDGKFTYFTFTDRNYINGYESVVAIDLNLSNEWYDKTITKYLDDSEFEKWFLGMQGSFLVALKSTDNIYIEPQSISYFVIDDTGDENRTKSLRSEFDQTIYP